jgi:membrane protease subunit (stomatin/prohibitin family)
VDEVVEGGHAGDACGINAAGQGQEGVFKEASSEQMGRADGEAGRQEEAPKQDDGVPGCATRSGHQERGIELVEVRAQGLKIEHGQGEDGLDVLLRQGLEGRGVVQWDEAVDKSQQMLTMVHC